MLPKKKGEKKNLVHCLCHAEVQESKRLLKSISFNRWGEAREGQKLGQGPIGSWWPIRDGFSLRTPGSCVLPYAIFRHHSSWGLTERG